MFSISWKRKLLRISQNLSRTIPRTFVTSDALYFRRLYARLSYHYSQDIEHVFCLCLSYHIYDTTSNKIQEITPFTPIRDPNQPNPHDPLSRTLFPTPTTNDVTADDTSDANSVVDENSTTDNNYSTTDNLSSNGNLSSNKLSFSSPRMKMLFNLYLLRKEWKRVILGDFTFLDSQVNFVSTSRLKTSLIAANLTSSFIFIVKIMLVMILWMLLSP